MSPEIKVLRGRSARARTHSENGGGKNGVVHPTEPAPLEHPISSPPPEARNLSLAESYQLTQPLFRGILHDRLQACMKLAMQSDSAGENYVAQRLRAEALQIHNLLNVVEGRVEPTLNFPTTHSLPDVTSQEISEPPARRATLSQPVRDDDSKANSEGINSNNRLVSHLSRLGIAFRDLGDKSYAELDDVLRSGRSPYNRRQIAALAKRGHPGLITQPDGSIRVSPEGVLRLFDYIPGVEAKASTEESFIVPSPEFVKPIRDLEPDAIPITPTLAVELQQVKDSAQDVGSSETDTSSETLGNVEGIRQIKVYKNPNHRGGKVVTPDGREIKFTESIGWDFLTWLTEFSGQVLTRDITKQKSIEFGYVGPSPISPFRRMLERLEKDPDNPEYFVLGEEGYVINSLVMDGDKVDSLPKVVVPAQPNINFDSTRSEFESQPATDFIPTPSAGISRRAELGLEAEVVPSLVLKPKPRNRGGILITPDGREVSFRDSAFWNLAEWIAGLPKGTQLSSTEIKAKVLEFNSTVREPLTYFYTFLAKIEEDPRDPQIIKKLGRGNYLVAVGTGQAVISEPKPPIRELANAPANRPSDLVQPIQHSPAITETANTERKPLLSTFSLLGLENLILSQILREGVDIEFGERKRKATGDILMLLEALPQSERHHKLSFIREETVRQQILDQLVEDLKARFSAPRSPSVTGRERTVAQLCQMLRAKHLTGKDVIDYIEKQYNH